MLATHSACSDIIGNFLINQRLARSPTPRCLGRQIDEERPSGGLFAPPFRCSPPSSRPESAVNPKITATLLYMLPRPTLLYHHKQRVELNRGWSLFESIFSISSPTYQIRSPQKKCRSRSHTDCLSTSLLSLPAISNELHVSIYLLPVQSKLSQKKTTLTDLVSLFICYTSSPETFFPCFWSLWWIIGPNAEKRKENKRKKRWVLHVVHVEVGKKCEKTTSPVCLVSCNTSRIAPVCLILVKSAKSIVHI